MNEAASVELDRCISTMYESVLDPERWTLALAQVVGLGNAAVGALFDVDLQLGIIWRGITHNISLEDNQLYLERYAAVDRRAARLLDPTTPAGTFVSDHELFDAKFRATDVVYREYLIPRGTVETCGAKVAAEGSRICTISLICCTEQGPMSTERRALASRALTHLDRAMRLARRMSTLAAVATLGRSMLDTHDEPIASVSASGQLLHSSRAFEALIAKRQGIALTAGSVSLVNADAQRQLAIALREAADLGQDLSGCSPTVSPLIAVPRPNRSPLMIAVMPLMTPASGANWFTRRGALLKVSDPLAVPAPALLQQAFRFTGAESRIACALMEGGTLKAVAQQQGVTANTVKAQVKSIYAKAGVESRSALLLAMRALPR